MPSLSVWGGGIRRRTTVHTRHRITQYETREAFLPHSKVMHGALVHEAEACSGVAGGDEDGGEDERRQDESQAPEGAVLGTVVAVVVTMPPHHLMRLRVWLGLGVWVRARVRLATEPAANVVATEPAANVVATEPAANVVATELAEAGGGKPAEAGGGKPAEAGGGEPAEAGGGKPAEAGEPAKKK